MAAKGKLESKIEWKWEKWKWMNLTYFTSFSNESYMQINDRVAFTVGTKTKIACVSIFNSFLPAVY